MCHKPVILIFIVIRRGGKVTLMLAIDTSRSMEEADDHRLAQKDFGIPTNASGINACYFGTYSNIQDLQTGVWEVNNQVVFQKVC